MVGETASKSIHLSVKTCLRTIRRFKWWYVHPIALPHWGAMPTKPPTIVTLLVPSVGQRPARLARARRDPAARTVLGT
jgi:hypothetical protein